VKTVLYLLQREYTERDTHIGLLLLASSNDSLVIDL